MLIFKITEVISSWSPTIARIAYYVFYFPIFDGILIPPGTSIIFFIIRALVVFSWILIHIRLYENYFRVIPFGGTLYLFFFANAYGFFLYQNFKHDFFVLWWIIFFNNPPSPDIYAPFVTNLLLLLFIIAFGNRICSAISLYFRKHFKKIKERTLKENDF